MPPKFLMLLFLTLAATLPAYAGRQVTGVFLEAQRCRVNDTVDFGCFQQKLTRFEQFVLIDDAGWLQKSIVAEALVKYYDGTHVKSPAEQNVRTKQAIYAKAYNSLDISERGQIGDCKDEANPDGCLKFRYCFKEAYIKVKNVLVITDPALFAVEIKHFDKDLQGDCPGN